MSPFGRRDDSPNGASRTEEEREQARLERERRRAERAARSAETPAPPAARPEVAPEPVAAEPPPPDVAPQPVAAEPPPPPPEVAPDPVAAEPPPPAPRRVRPPEVAPEPVAAQPAAPPVDEPAWLQEPPPAPPAPAPEAPRSDHQPEPELPAGVLTVEHAHDRPVELRRAPSPSVRDLPRIAGPTGGRPQTRSPRRRRRRLLLIFPLLVLVAIGWFLNALFEPFAGDPHGSVRVTIPQGASASDVGDVLERQGVVKSAFFFGLRARLAGKNDLKAGSFTLKQDMTYGAALDALARNPAAPKTINVTIPEGRSIGETAPLVRQAGLTGDYRAAAAKAPAGFPRRRFRVPRSVRTLEGFLFPATYELRPGAPARKLVTEQLAMFQRSFGRLDMRYARRKNLTPYDVVIIASMIEREAGVPQDRKLISAVIYNRLKQGIPLGIDATLRYRLNQWSKPLRVSELNTSSPFNTRRHQGLPPTPIGNPGLASLQAATAPAKVRYRYYVVKPCGNGRHAFSSTDAQFQRDVAAYNRKRDQLGGKDPSHC